MYNVGLLLSFLFWLAAAACCSCKLSGVYYIGPTLRVCRGMALSNDNACTVFFSLYVRCV
jgi:hypothetical protein